MSLNGKFNTYIPFNIEQELNIAFLEVLLFFCLIYWQKKGCKSKLALGQWWWQCYVTFTFWAWLNNCPRCCSEVRHREFLNSQPQKGNLAQNTWGWGYGIVKSYVLWQTLDRSLCRLSALMAHSGMYMVLLWVSGFCLKIFHLLSQNVHYFQIIY